MKRATIQVDIDPYWFIAGLFSCNESKKFTEEKTIYQEIIPLFLDRFRAHGIRATFFVVGRDFEDKRNLPVMERLLAEGHEIANHSYQHRTDLKRIEPALAFEEIDRFQTLFEQSFGLKAVGYKSPAYGIAPAILAHLEEQGYRYDSSVFPNTFGPVVKAAQQYWLRYRKGKSEFGDLRAACAPHRPYWPSRDDLYSRGTMKLVELPVSAMPMLRLPFHFSFVNVGGLKLYRLGQVLQTLSRCRYLNYAFHGIDLADRSIAPEQIRHRPGMGMSQAKKLHNMDVILDHITRRYQVYPSQELAGMIETEALKTGPGNTAQNADAAEA